MAGEPTAGARVLGLANRVQSGLERKMHLKFQLNALNGFQVEAIKDNEFNQLSSLAAVPRKLNSSSNPIILKYIL